MTHAAQKYMNGLLESGLLVPSSGDIASADVLIPATPPSHRADQLWIEEAGYKHLWKFAVLASELGLPTNNPVAFFHEMAGRINAMATNPEMKSTAKTLLQRVYADCSFLFGSSFDSMNPQRNALRASDLYWIAYQTGASNETGNTTAYEPFRLVLNSSDEEKLLMHMVLRYQSQLNSARRFCEDYLSFRDQFEVLEKRQKLYLEWEQEIERKNAVQVPFRITREKGRKFFEIYKTFSLLQCANKRQRTNLLKRLEELEKELQTAFMLFRFLSIIDRCVNKLQNTNGKLYDFFVQVLSKLTCQMTHYFKNNTSAINSLVFSENISPKSQDEKSEELQDTVNSFIKVIKKRNPDSEETMAYPTFFFCGKTRHVSLSENEKYLINDLKSHPLIRCIMQIQEELRKHPVQEASAFYLFQIFNHAGNIRAPFSKSSYQFKSHMCKLEPTPMSTDSTAVRNQRSSIFLFNALGMLCYAIFPDSFQEKLCDYLFERCRGYVPHLRYIINLADVAEIHESAIPQYGLQYDIDQRLHENLKLDVMCFQQYALTQCTAEDFYQFFFHPDTSEDKKVLKQIVNTISDDKFHQYCKIALYSPDGYGTSHQPIEWHEQMSKFLDDIIDADDILCQYVDGENKNSEEITLGNGLSFDAWSTSFHPSDGSKLEKGQYLTNHARVQLAIHAVCLKRAAEIARKEALQCYKQIFF